ncbi:PQQ-like beta-propeller repeat protein [Fictibacillus sp. KIGAM418]|uniref:PQQ-like beta-propeller repeat protein n=1 Tax=Fictibacillus marinisediminis TaxID=2878389 RepID=A0A9X1XE18_9BACL|nr:PQQ-like beta-propeller repeat protein [Fictibacillus marinisediminis]MCK6259099.1 PQQ-like beta-propeller repeat protein [Fictibacillus marinisediminis]
MFVGTYPGGKVFKYDPLTSKVTDYGRMIGAVSQEYIRSLAVIGDNIYSGTGHGQIVRYNMKTGEKEDIAKSINEPGHIYDLEKVDDRYLFARFELSSNGYIYDTQEKKWLDVTVPNVRGLHVEEQSLNNKIYFMSTDNKLRTVDLSTLKIEDTGIEYESGFRGVDWVEFNTPELPGKSLVTINFSGYVTIINLETKKVTRLPSLVQSTPTVMQAIEKGPDGNFYISGMQTAKGAQYNPVTGKVTSFNLGQADSMAPLGDKMLMGVYPSGDIRAYDPALPPSDTNPEKLFVLGESQNRIKTISSGGGKAFIGSIPFYGELGGALTVYDPQAEGEKYKVFRNVVQDQSVVGLAYKDGKVYGSTSITGGLGADPTAEEAKIFVWDVKNEKKISEISLNVEGIEKPNLIGELSIGPDGLLWGAVKNAIFALDPETLNVVKSKKIYPDGVLPADAWGSIDLKWSNGLLYADFTGGNLTAIDPKTLDSKKITNAYSFSIGDDGDIYYSLGSNRTLLYKIEVDPISKIKPIHITNSSFEMPLMNGTVPGWTSMFAADSEVQYSLSGEQYSKGIQSLKLVDASHKKSVALMSTPVKVNPGDVLKAETRLYLKEGLSSLMLRYFDSNGKEISSTPVHTEAGYNSWQPVTITAKAPERATSAKVLAYSTAYATTTSYYDNVKLSKLILKK